MSVTWRNCPSTGGSGGCTCFSGRGAFVGGLLLAPEDHDDAACGVELDDHVGAFVGDPDVVLWIDSDGVREGPCVEVVPDLAKVGAVGGELEELCGACAVGGASGVAAREDEDVPFGVDRDAGGLAKVDVGRKLEKIGDGVERDFRD